MQILSADVNITCPIEATYVALLENIDGENAHSFAQMTQMVCHEQTGFKTDFVIDSIARCAVGKGFPIDGSWANQMKENTLRNGFPDTLNNHLVSMMLRIDYPYTEFSNSTN